MLLVCNHHPPLTPPVKGERNNLVIASSRSFGSRNDRGFAEHLLKGVCLAACLLFLFFLSPLFAEEAGVFHLGEIVVTPDEEGMARSSMIEVDAEEIENKNAHTVAEALGALPGVYVTKGAKNEPYIKLRGMSQEKILVLVNGIPVSGPYYGYVNLNQVPVENIAKIKVIKGPTSVLYGADALGGVVNIITKKPHLKPLTGLSLSAAPYDTYHAEFTHSQQRNKLSLFLSASSRQSDGFALSDDFEATPNEDGGKRENSDYKRDAFSLKLGLDEPEDSSFALLFNYIDNQEGVPYHTTNLKPRYWRFPEWKKWNVALAQETKLTPRFSLKGRIFYDKFDNILKSYDDASLTTQIEKSAFTSTYDDYGVGGSLQPVFFWKDNHLLKGALHFKKDVHKEQPDAGEEWEKYRCSTFSLGLEEEIDFGENLSLILGDSFNLFHSKDKDIDCFDFYLKTEYSPDENNQCWLALAEKSRFPTLHQLYSSYSGNLSLKQEKSFSAELGLAHQWREVIDGRLTLFASRVKDLIEREGKYEPYLNISRANFRGIEAEIEAKLNKSHKLILGYTYLYAQEKTAGTERRLRYTPANEAFAKLEGAARSGLAYYLSASYVGKRYWYTEDIRNELPGHWLVEGRISRKLAGHFEGFVSIDNLLDSDYEKEDGFPQPGRVVWVGINGWL